MELSITHIKSMSLAGKVIQTSLAENRTKALWQSLMRDKAYFPPKEFQHLYSVEIYPNTYFKTFDPTQTFQKWACVEWPDEHPLPHGFSAITIPEGLYAVCHYKGHHLKAFQTFQYLFNEWLPASDYVVDQRPHFEHMGKGYRGDSDDSEEFFYIPLAPK
jgi:AraC family transcriptional regulator